MASQSPDQSRGNGRMPVGTWITGPKEPSAEQNIHHIPKILPHERVFPIQIGGELFKLSGASLSSDGERARARPDPGPPPPTSLLPLRDDQVCR